MNLFSPESAFIDEQEVQFETGDLNVSIHLGMYTLCFIDMETILKLASPTYAQVTVNS